MTTFCTDKKTVSWNKDVIKISVLAYMSQPHFWSPDLLWPSSLRKTQGQYTSPTSSLNSWPSVTYSIVAHIHTCYTDEADRWHRIAWIWIIFKIGVAYFFMYSGIILLHLCLSLNVSTSSTRYYLLWWHQLAWNHNKNMTNGQPSCCKQPENKLQNGWKRTCAALNISILFIFLRQRIIIVSHVPGFFLIPTLAVICVT